MLYREVPKNGDKLSILGYGCMRFPVRMNAINEKLAEKQMLHAMDQGVNYFDTAYPYHRGKSEPFLGKVFSRNSCRDKVKIATKLPSWLVERREDMDRYLHRQLERLGTANLVSRLNTLGLASSDLPDIIDSIPMKVFEATPEKAIG